MYIKKYQGVEQIANITISKARFQKVLLVYGNYINSNFVDSLKCKLYKECLLICMGINDEQLGAEIRSGYRCVIEVLNDRDFLKLRNLMPENVCLINCQPNNICLHKAKVEEQIVLLNNRTIGCGEYLLLTNICIEKIWSDYVIGKSAEEDLCVLQNLLKNTQATITNIGIVYDAKGCIFENLVAELKDVENINCYLYYRLVAIFCLFKSFYNGNPMIVDVFKSYNNDIENIGVGFSIILNEHISFLLKNNSGLILNLLTKIIEKIKVKLNKIKFQNDVAILKNNGKNIKSDNLLKYSYLFNIFQYI